jgi:hypothetical protein
LEERRRGKRKKEGGAKRAECAEDQKRESTRGRHRARAFSSGGEAARTAAAAQTTWVAPWGTGGRRTGGNQETDSETKRGGTSARTELERKKTGGRVGRRKPYGCARCLVLGTDGGGCPNHVGCSLGHGGRRTGGTRRKPAQTNGENGMTTAEHQPHQCKAGLPSAGRIVLAALAAAAAAGLPRSTIFLKAIPHQVIRAKMTQPETKQE